MNYNNRLRRAVHWPDSDWSISDVATRCAGLPRLSSRCLARLSSLGRARLTLAFLPSFLPG